MGCGAGTVVYLALLLHAALTFSWLDALQLTPNPFLSPTVSLSPLHILPTVLALAALLALGSDSQVTTTCLCSILQCSSVLIDRKRRQGPVLWLMCAAGIFIGSYQIWPVDGGGPLSMAPGGPDPVVLIVVVGVGLLLSPFTRPLSLLLGKWEPSELLSQASREHDEEQYYTKSAMPFKPKKIIECQVAAEVAAIGGG